MDQVTRGRLLAEIREHLQTQRDIAPERVNEDARLRDDLGLDSLDVAEMGMGWAGEYGVLLEEDQILNMETVREAIDYVLANVPAAREG
jgi:acyl carrier protein